MNKSRAFVAGLLGGLVMGLMITIAHTAGITRMNMPLYLGSAILRDISTAAYILGWAMHLLISGLIALIYAAGFEYVVHRAGGLMGAGFGLIHFLISGVAIGMMSKVHPLMIASIPSPIFSAAGRPHQSKVINRNHAAKPWPGERADHPHDPRQPRPFDDAGERSMKWASWPVTITHRARAQLRARPVPAEVCSWPAPTTWHTIHAHAPRIESERPGATGA